MFKWQELFPLVEKIDGGYDHMMRVMIEPHYKTEISIICILASFILQESKDMQCKTEYYQLIQV